MYISYMSHICIYVIYVIYDIYDIYVIYMSYVTYIYIYIQLKQKQWWRNTMGWEWIHDHEVHWCSIYYTIQKTGAFTQRLILLSWFSQGNVNMQNSTHRSNRKSSIHCISLWTWYLKFSNKSKDYKAKLPS